MTEENAVLRKITRKLDVRTGADTHYGNISIISPRTLGEDMVVKSVRGRRRYISFTAGADMRRDDMAPIVESFGIPSVKLITCGKGKAVVRCDPAHRDELIDAYIGAFPGCCSLKTSGTLRTLRDEDASLRVPRKRKK